MHDGAFSVATAAVDLDDKVVIDAGAGSGKVALEAVRHARHVFAVEPVARLREFMRDRAAASAITNLFVLDGTLDAIPLPTDTADVLLTCRAIGWRLEEELVEIERVVRAGGVALHLGHPHPPPDESHLHQRLIEVGYSIVTYPEGQEQRTSYRKRI